METEKTMPGTTKAPTGAHPATARAQRLDLVTAADRLVAKLPGNARQAETIAREAGVSVVMMAMEGGDAIKEHSADGVVLVQLLRGHAVLTADNQPYDLRPGEVVMMQPGVRHDVRAEEQTVVVLTITGGNE